MTHRRVLLLSSSRDPSGSFLAWAAAPLRDLLADAAEVLFVPYAGVVIGWDEYADRTAEALEPLGVRLTSVHRLPDPRAAIAGAAAILVGGGNTFRLLERLYQTQLLEPIRERVAAGVPYVGWSAGSVVACPTIATTNDMPIVGPPSFRALALVPFQINAHYTDAHPSRHQGETRAQRIAEFLVLNPAVRVVGLREGGILRVRDGTLALLGNGGARVFAHGREPADYVAGDDVEFLLADAS